MRLLERIRRQDFKLNRFSMMLSALFIYHNGFELVYFRQNIFPNMI